MISSKDEHMGMLHILNLLKNDFSGYNDTDIFIKCPRVPAWYRLQCKIVRVKQIDYM